MICGLSLRKESLLEIHIFDHIDISILLYISFKITVLIFYTVFFHKMVMISPPKKNLNIIEWCYENFTEMRNIHFDVLEDWYVFSFWKKDTV